MCKNEVVNVKMNTADSILNKIQDVERITDVVLEHLLATRPIKKPVWNPYVYMESVAYRKTRKHDIYVEMNKIYPEHKAGDVAYVSANIKIEKDYTVWINVVGLVSVFLDGKCIFSAFEDAKNSAENMKYFSVPVNLKKDATNNLVLKYVFNDINDGFWLNISPPNCVSLWANFYLVMVRLNLPMEGFTKEEGIAFSPIYTGFDSLEEAYFAKCDFEKRPVYRYPEIINEENLVDFSAMYNSGKYAIAYSCAEMDGFITFVAKSETDVYINNSEVCTACENSVKTIRFTKNDEIILRSKKENDWGFEIKNCKGLSLDMLETDRKKDFRFMYCGPFYTDEILKVCKNEIRPVLNEKGETVFWRFQHAELRAYIDSSFFGHWYYATMLCCYGMQYAGNALGITKYREYFVEMMSFLADWYDYARYDFSKYNFANFMSGASSEKLLDFNGTMGVNFIEAYKITGDKKYLSIIEKLYENVKTKISRFEDGTFCRKESGTMWADDFFMACPFLIRLYKDLGVKECLDEIVTQIHGFKKRLYMSEKKIFSHIFFLDTELKNCIPWGRGNGWVALSLSEVLLALKDETGDKIDVLRSAFAEFCEGLSEFQDEEGMWHQVLDRADSYQEASCTAMFTLAMYRGVKYGWIDKKYISNVKLGLKALLSKCVDKDGVFYNVCMGSSCSMDVSYYLRLGTVKDDNHGTGVLLMLFGDMIMNGDGGIAKEL